MRFKLQETKQLKMDFNVVRSACSFNNSQPKQAQCALSELQPRIRAQGEKKLTTLVISIDLMTT